MSLGAINAVMKYEVNGKLFNTEEEARDYLRIQNVLELINSSAPHCDGFAHNLAAAEWIVENKAALFHII